MNSLLLRMFASFGNLQHNKPRQSQPSAATTLTSSRACAGRYVSLGVTMQIGKFTFLVAILALLIFVSFNQHTRWLSLNGVAATKLSKDLLNQQVKTTPDWAIDMVIIASSKSTLYRLANMVPIICMSIAQKMFQIQQTIRGSI